MTTSTWTRQHSMVPCAVVLAAGAVFATLMLTSTPASSAATPAPQFPAHATTASSGLPGSSPSPTMADMPGMDQSTGGMPGSSPSPTMAANSPWSFHDDTGTQPHSHGTTGPAADRPLAAVLSTFGGGTSVVMLSAGLLRRRDRASSQARQAARAAARAQK